MNLSALEYFREVVETKSISKVAANRHISQSALSQNIQKLEDELGYKLLERSNKGVVPTEAGRIIFKYSGTMMRVYEKMSEELESLKYSVENVRINGFLSLVDYSLPCVLYKVKKKYPNYNFEMHSRSNMDSVNDLINDLTDLCFVNEQPVDDRLDSTPIGRERIVLVANVNAKIPDTIDVDELLNYEMVLLDDPTLPIANFLKHKLRVANVSFEKLRVMFKVDTVPAAKSSINNQLGICFLPYMAIKKELYEKRYKIIEVKNFNLDYIIFLISQKREQRTRAVEDVLMYFIENGEKDFC